MKRLTNSTLNYLFIVPFLTLISFSCNQQLPTADKSFDPEQKRNFLLPTNQNPDTIFTGESHPIEFEEFDLDTLPKPQIIPLSRSVKEVKAYSNTYPVIPPKVSFVPKRLTPIIPGKEGHPLPREISFRKEVIPAKFPEPIKAPRPFMKEDARFNIQSLNLDNGALDKISMVTRDLKGNLWIGTQENGVSCYDGHYITTFSVGEGLKSNYIASVFVDKKGNIWMLSPMEILTKFDGKTFTHYYLEGVKNEAGASTYFMDEDKKGNIWITFSGAMVLVKYQPEEGENMESFTQYSVGENIAYWEAFVDSEEHLWVGTSLGVFRFDGQYFSHIGKKEGLSDKIIFTMQEDKHGNIWISGGEGLFKFEYGSGRQRDKIIGPYQFEGIEFFVGLLTEMDEMGHLWCALVFQRGGMGRYNMDENGDIVSFSYFGEEEGFTDNQKSLMQKDWAGNIWIGTKGEGLNYYGKNQFQFFGKKEGLNSNTISAIKEDIKGVLWFGTFQWDVRPFMGVNRYNPDAYDGQGSFTHITYEEGLIDDKITDILTMKNGDIWFGSNGGGGSIGILSTAESNKEKIFTNFYHGRRGGFLDLPVMSFAEDKRGRIWTNNFRRYELNQFGIPKKFRKYDFKIRAIKDIAEDLMGGVWFGLFHQVGAVRLNPLNNTYTIYSKNEGLSPAVEPMLQDSRGNMWFGTLGDGLKYIDRNSFETEQIQFKTYKDPYGFLDDYIYSLQEDRNKNIWISARNGIGVLVPPSSKDSLDNSLSISDYTYYHFGKDEGLKSYAFSKRSVCLDQNHQLWWGTQKGAVRLDLDQFELPDNPPQNVRLSHLTLGNQYIDFRSLRDTAYQNIFSFGKKLSQSFDSISLFDNYPINLSLPFKLNHLTFYFSAQDWAAPNQIRYSYMFEGLDDQWSAPQEENKVGFRNIPAGKHVLKIKAIGAARKWSEPFEYPFTIRPPWYWNIWSMAIYSFLILLFGYWLYQFLLNRRLEKAETIRLRELDEVKTKLYTNITHEFRTPLTIIRGMTHKMKDNPKKWFSDGINMINRNSDQLLNLINQILDLRKLESGKLSLQPIQSDIIAYLKYHLEAFHSYAEERDIRLHFMSEMDELQMDFAPKELQHIMNNLISNAIKYNKEGGDVYVSVAKTNSKPKREAATPLGGWGAEMAKSNTNQFLNIKIQDTGIGIPSDQLPYLFDRFYQADSAAHRQLAKAGEGTGIGLALSKELVKLMNGNISVKSQEGEGTTFEVLLPITQTRDPVAATELGVQSHHSNLSSSPAAEIETVTKLASLPQILIVEDNKDVVYYLQSCLQADYQLEVAHNGAEGVEKALELVPDLIISDVMMPKKDGFELCAELKQDVRTSHIPIILLTAKGDLDSRLQGLEHGADAYLSKPFEEKELLVRIEQMIKLRKSLQEKYGGPLGQMATPSNNAEEQFLQKIYETVMANLEDENFGIAQLCRAMHLSRTQLHRKLKSLTNKSTSFVIREIRLQKAKELLSSTDLSISQIAYEVGFSKPGYFTEVFVETYGQTPREYRKE